VRPFPIPHVHDWRKMQVCLINFNKEKCSQRLRDVTGKRGHAFEVDQKVVGKLLKRTEM
jgi:hypothetical protein